MAKRFQTEGPHFSRDRHRFVQYHQHLGWCCYLKIGMKYNGGEFELVQVVLQEAAADDFLQGDDDVEQAKT